MHSKRAISRLMWSILLYILLEEGIVLEIIKTLRNKHRLCQKRDRRLKLRRFPKVLRGLAGWTTVYYAGIEECF